jgi:hypothetical protein
MATKTSNLGGREVREDRRRCVGGDVVGQNVGEAMYTCTWMCEFLGNVLDYGRKGRLVSLLKFDGRLPRSKRKEVRNSELGSGFLLIGLGFSIVS